MRIIKSDYFHQRPLSSLSERLAGKIRAAGVVGNIGEAIAAIFARRYLGAAIGEIAHVRPRRPFIRRKAPDYLMRLGARMPGTFSPIIPAGASFSWPNWWPVESKARSTKNGCNEGRRQALGQLVAYWSLLASSEPGSLGYGVIVLFRHQTPREVRVSLILPRNQTLVIQELQENGENIEYSTLRTCLYGC